MRVFSWIAYASVFAIFLSFAYLPIDAPLSHGSVVAAAVFQKNVRLHHVVNSGIPIDFPPQEWIAGPTSKFLKMDRKQNLRLWPVIYSWLTRSPPLTNLA